MFSIQKFHRRYDTETRDTVVAGRPFCFVAPRSLDPFLNPDDPLHLFPLWAKIWEASLVLAHRVAAIPPDPDVRWLELGAGLGLVGVVAAACGHDITITEYDSHALDFIHANADINGCQPRSIRRLDWMQPDIDTRFHRIIGSELIYNEKDFPALRQLFASLLEPGGEILLAGEARQTSGPFLDLMTADFNIEIARNTLRSENSRIAVLLMRLRPKPGFAA